MKSFHEAHCSGMRCHVSSRLRYAKPLPRTGWRCPQLHQGPIFRGNRPNLGVQQTKDSRQGEWWRGLTGTTGYRVYKS